jgi:hypothetical protein
MDHLIGIVLFIVHVVLLGACSRTLHMNAPMTVEFQKASKSSVDIEERIESACLLSNEERIKLRLKLSAELPGNWDKGALDAIRVLGFVGDRNTIELLETIDRTPREEGGRFHGVILEAIARIRRRTLVESVVP